MDTPLYGHHFRGINWENTCIFVSLIWTIHTLWTIFGWNGAVHINETSLYLLYHTERYTQEAERNKCPDTTQAYSIRSHTGNRNKCRFKRKLHVLIFGSKTHRWAQSTYCIHCTATRKQPVSWRPKKSHLVIVIVSQYNIQDKGDLFFRSSREPLPEFRKFGDGSRESASEPTGPCRLFDKGFRW
ncbi:hypothetical protein ANAPC5_01092 [Anaplasma phagocytophilum]|nr:hypothetical protein ANAPC5_01092 [Anaplasma phagocytophilum]